MSTSHTWRPPVVTGMYAGAVAKVTGLSERELENLHPDTFGSPGHWMFMRGGNGGMFYRKKGLCVLIEQLRNAGRVAESVALSKAARGGYAEGGKLVGLRPLESPEPIPLHHVQAETDRANEAMMRARGWCAQWEEQHS